MRRDYLLLSVILLFSFFLQVYGINHGLPYHFGHDESLIVESAMRTGLGDLSPPHFGWPGSFHKYILFIVFGTYFILGKLLGIFSGLNDFSTFFLLEPSSFYLIARLVSVFSGIVAILVIYLIANKLYNKRVGLLSSLLLSATFTFINLCQSAKQDVTMVLFMLLSFLSLSLILKTGFRKYYVLAGVFAGLAISEKYSAGFVVISIIMSHYFWKYNNRESLKSFYLDKNILIAFLSLGIIFFLCNPYVIINPRGLWNGFSSLLFNYSSIARVGIQQSSVNPYIYLVTNIMREGLGIILETVVLIGLIYCIYRRKQQDLLLLSFIIPYLLVAGTMKSMAPHHLLPAIVIMIIPGALFICKFIVYFFKNKRSQELAFKVIPILIILNPLYSIIKYDNLISHKDTREIAKEWIEENIENGATIAIEDGTYSPALVRSQKSLRKVFDDEKRVGKGRAIEILLDITKENYPKITYDVIGIWKDNEGFFIRNWDRSAKDVINDLKKENTDLIIVSSFSYKRYFDDETLRNLFTETQERRKFYELLDEEEKILKIIKPNKIDKPGPTIKIYKIK